MRNERESGVVSQDTGGGVGARKSSGWWKEIATWLLMGIVI